MLLFEMYALFFWQNVF